MGWWHPRNLSVSSWPILAIFSTLTHLYALPSPGGGFQIFWFSGLYSTYRPSSSSQTFLSPASLPNLKPNTILQTSSPSRTLSPTPVSDSNLDHHFCYLQNVLHEKWVRLTRTRGLKSRGPKAPTVQPHKARHTARILQICHPMTARQLLEHRQPHPGKLQPCKLAYCDSNVHFLADQMAISRSRTDSFPIRKDKTSGVRYVTR